MSSNTPPEDGAVTPATSLPRTAIHQKYADGIGFGDAVKESWHGRFGAGQVQHNGKAATLDHAQRAAAFKEKGLITKGVARISGNLGQGSLIGKKGLAIGGTTVAAGSAFYAGRNTLRAFGLAKKKEDINGNPIDVNVITDIAVPAGLTVGSLWLAGRGGLHNATHTR